MQRVNIYMWQTVTDTECVCDVTGFLASVAAVLPICASSVVCAYSYNFFCSVAALTLVRLEEKLFIVLFCVHLYMCLMQWV